MYEYLFLGRRHISSVMCGTKGIKCETNLEKRVGKGGEKDSTENQGGKPNTCNREWRSKTRRVIGARQEEIKAIKK